MTDIQTTSEPTKDSDKQMSGQHSTLTQVIWNVANSLRGTYRPPQYRRVMLPLIVLARFDAILSPYTDKMKAFYEANEAKPEDKRTKGVLFDAAMSAHLGLNRDHPLYNVSGYNLTKLLADSEHISANLLSYIQGFSPKARDIFEKFEFENEIHKLDDKNKLFQVIESFVTDIQKSGIDLSPAGISNLQMGYVFEDLVRRFNEQANEEAGDHFTPREVIELMVNIIFEEDQNELIKAGVYRSIYDPTAGTGGMLSEAEKYLKSYNDKINIALYGQEYNAESYAICCSDLLIKDEPIDNIIYGDTLGIKNSKNKSSGFVPHDGHEGKKFHYMFANPPYGVDWKTQKDFIEDEANLGADGRFEAGLPRINDGSLLFLQHMISKMHDAPEEGGDGSRIAVVFNGSPLFTGDAGSGESNIRRWIIENDWLEAIIALPDQMFYNTGIYTYIWIVSNKKPANKQGKVQLIDATDHYQKMRKSLGNKRHELGSEHIKELTQLYANYKDEATSQLIKDKNGDAKVCSKIFNNQDFGYIKLTVERPLRLNFQASSERIDRLDNEAGFINLAKSRKLKDPKQIAAEEKAGNAQQQAIKDALAKMDGDKLYKDRDAFLKVLNPILKDLNFKIGAPLKKSILQALSEKDPSAQICKDSKGNPEPDSELRDTEVVLLPDNIALPLPIHYDNETGLDELLELIKPHCEQYMADEVLPHVDDAWVEYSRTRVGYEIPINRHFYVYEPPRALEDIKSDIVELEQTIIGMLGGLSA